MKIFEFETVESLPLLYHPELDLIVVSDLHLGLEGSMTHDGNYVPKIQLEEILGDLEEAKQETGAGRILVNGDIKNEFSGSRYSENQEIREFLDFLEENFEEKILVRGNHDNFVDRIINEYGLELRDYYLEDGVLFTHGHREPEKMEIEMEIDLEYDTVVIGHEHPALALKDEIGVREKVNCFLYGETDKGRNILVLPSFSSISQGTNVNETPQEELLSPLLRKGLNKSELEAVAVSREAGIFEFPEIGKF